MNLQAFWDSITFLILKKPQYLNLKCFVVSYNRTEVCCCTSVSPGGGPSSRLSQTRCEDMSAPWPAGWRPLNHREPARPDQKTVTPAHLSKMIVSLDYLTYHSITAIISQNDDINGWSVIGHTYSSLLWSVLSEKNHTVGIVTFLIHIDFTCLPLQQLSRFWKK